MSGHTIGIDPGVRHLGFAIACGGEIRVAGCSSHEPQIGGVDRLAALAHRHERTITRHYETIAPVVYLESMSAAAGRATTAQDLIDVQTVGCLVAGVLYPSRVLLLTPADWKGSTPKAIYHERMIGALAEPERQIVRAALLATPKDHHKEVLDAVGILLYGLGRIERTGEKRK